MTIVGVAKIDCKTKNLIHRLSSKDIAIIDHEDLDYVCAYALAAKKVKAVINKSSFISGKYPNRGTDILLDNKIPLYENIDRTVFKYIKENDKIEIKNNLLCKNEIAVPLKAINKSDCNEFKKKSLDNLQNEMYSFIDNTLYYMKKEKTKLFHSPKLPFLDIAIANRPVVLVTRGEYYIEDLIKLKDFIKKKQPVLIGVDGGGDGLTFLNYIPDIIFGDMDSVSDATLRKSRNIVLHSYDNGICPGENRIKKLGLPYSKYSCFGTSEDGAILMCYYMNASYIVIVGSHNNLIDFLEKNRKGMASTILTRILVGSKLVDVKGIFRLF
ncbi:MAG: hypothetical protein GX327_04925 [Epulopiscium sp.]|nr:hypothetical protein [Candidatus Epulonipiscium sp.]